MENIKFTEVDDLNKSCVMTGVIMQTSLKTNKDGYFTVDVFIRKLQKVIKDVPIIYNCEDELKDHPFSAQARDDVLILNRGAKSNPTVKDLTIIGFKDGLTRYCKKYLYVNTGLSFGLRHNPSAKMCFVWDLEKNNYAEISDGKGGLISFPCDSEQDDIKLWRKQRTSEGKKLWGTLQMCDQGWPGEQHPICDKGECIDTDTKLCAAATGWHYGRPAPFWAHNDVCKPFIESSVAPFLDEYAYAGNAYARVEWEESGAASVTGNCEVFTHLSEGDGSGYFAYTVNWTKCANELLGQIKTITNAPRLIRSFGSNQISNTIIAQTIFILVVRLDRTKSAGCVPDKWNTHNDFIIVAQADLFPEGVQDVDPTTLSRNNSFEIAIKEAFDIAFNQSQIQGHSWLDRLSFWNFFASLEIYGGGE